jgi:hypothetical protein
LNTNTDETEVTRASNAEPIPLKFDTSSTPIAITIASVNERMTTKKLET